MGAPRDRFADDRPRSVTDDLLDGTRVLVTGGTGSIGSSIVRTLLTTSAVSIRILGRDEAHQVRLRDRLPDDPRLEWWLGDVRDAARVCDAVAGRDAVVHAAAMKHVLLCEENPSEAEGINVAGTAHLLAASAAESVRRLVLISTDKAVAPAGVLGRTKRRAEELVLAAAAEGRHACVVRLGNVVGSRGSLLPRVLERARGERTIELVDRRVTRFWMTPREAAERTMEAMGRAGAGEIHVPLMPSAGVRDLVEAFLGLEFPGETPRVGERSLGPGEKEHEVVVAPEEVARLVLGDRSAVIGPVGAPETRSVGEVPDAMRSDRAPRLEGDALRAWLERARSESDAPDGPTAW